jgi:hypothetical protein
MSRQTPSTAWSELERVALLGTRRDALQMPDIAPALDELLAGLQHGDSEHLLLSAAGTLDLYEQIGRMPARLRPDSRVQALQEIKPACPPQAAVYIAQMLEGPLRDLLPEFLAEMQKAGFRLPETFLPNLLAYAEKRPKVRPLILPVLGRRGRWLAAQHQRWAYAAVDPASWPSIRSAWEEASKVQRASLVAQIRAENPGQGRALVENTWRGEDDQRRVLLIKELETGLSIADEPLLESALDDRSHLVRRKAAQLLSYLPQSRYCRRMINFVPLYLSWTPDQTRQIMVSLPVVTPEMRRNGIIGVKSSVAARVRGQEIIQLISGVPLDYWTESWEADPWAIARAIPTTAWPRTLTSGFSTAAVRQNNALWAQALIDELGITQVTKKMIPTLEQRELRAYTLRAISDLSGAEIDKDSTLITILRSWPGAWDMEIAARMVAVFSVYFRATADKKVPNNLIREVFLKLGRHAEPDLHERAAEMLNDPQKLGPWRNAAVEFLHTLRFRRDMINALLSKPPRFEEVTSGE